MRVVVTGSTGQLGSALRRMLDGHAVLGLVRPQHDITDMIAIDAAIQDFGPDVVVHTAAMTDVDGCERDPQMARRVNVLGTRNVAVAAHRAGAKMVYISTDYVFDGRKPEPYWEYDDVNPLSVYGRTKWLGEEVVRHLLSRHYIVRTAWLYGEGANNFVGTVLRLAEEHESLGMVTDEVGSPTFALDLAGAIARLVETPAYGTYHLCNAGTCSRYQWAREILDLAGYERVRLVPNQNYERLAPVPKRVALENFCAAELGITMRPWRDALRARFAVEHRK
ncbi:MAG: dTDP-4-dehydrorhamnose reductase [Chloroflexota bacterium]|nr:dTDP-4-dehydrorhamnose reductase [Chloroflexota bacterium]